MKQTYTIKGMTCGKCKASVEDYIRSVEGVTDVVVSLEGEEASIVMDSIVSMEVFKNILPEKFSLLEKQNKKGVNEKLPTSENAQEVSKLKQLQPLLLILFYLTTAVILFHYKDLDLNEIMIDFMGLFFIVFSFFKMLDLKNFPTSFSMYDPLAKKLHFYGWIYPFIETTLGLMFLMRIEILSAIIITVIVLGITTVGVTKTLIDKQSIQCACLGTALKLPMTEATFIENILMLSMSIFLLLGE
jgi:copper chaperone CopZ|tara:strand:- start:1940 stop:2671 length:732 start_codon:yes stop_codon:yes gene_type:complete